MSYPTETVGGKKREGSHDAGIGVSTMQGERKGKLPEGLFLTTRFPQRLTNAGMISRPSTASNRMGATK